MKTIHILDYGVGNIGSLFTMFDSLGYTPVVTADADTVRSSPLLILPGVGCAATAMVQLNARKLLPSLLDRHNAGQSIIGVCLGAQLLFEFLEEAESPGVGFLKGAVMKIKGSPQFHTGWSQLDWDQLQMVQCAGRLRKTDTFYFNHQYVFPRTEGLDWVTVEANPDTPAMYFSSHLCGIQFHPEKSQAPGGLLMGNVLRRYYGL